MAYVHEIKFYQKNETLYAALFDKPPIFCNEFWIKNVKASELGVEKLPENIQLKKKYRVRDLGIDSILLMELQLQPGKKELR